MSKRTFNLVVGIAGGVSAIAVAVVTYLNPSHSAAVNAAIGIADTALVEICSLFTEKE